MESVITDSSQVYKHLFRFRFHPFFWFLCSIPLLHVLLLLSFGLQHPVTPFVQLLRPLGSGWAAAWVIWTVFRVQGPHRLAWCLQAISMLCGALFSALKITTGASTEQLFMRVLWLLLYSLSIIATALYLRVQSLNLGTTSRVLISGCTVGVATFAILNSTLPELYPPWGWNERIQLFMPTLSFDIGLLFALLVVTLRYDLKTTPLIPLAFLAILCLLIADTISAFIAWAPWNDLYQGYTFVVYPLFTLQSILIAYGAYCDLHYQSGRNIKQPLSIPYREWFLWSMLPQLFVFAAFFATSQFAEISPILMLAVVIVAIIHAVLADRDYRRVYKNFRQVQAELATTNADLLSANVELQRRQQIEADLAAERARTAMARDIHDSLGGHLHAATSLASVLVEQDGLPPRLQRALGLLHTSVSQAHQEMRRAITVLKPDAPDDGPQPLETALAGPVEDARRYGLPVALEVQGEARPVPAGTAAELVQVVREALTNAHKYAQATEVRVVLDWTDPVALTLTIADNGIGMQTPSGPRAAGTGNGMANMRARVKALGGTLEWPPVERGVTLWIHIPQG